MLADSPDLKIMSHRTKRQRGLKWLPLSHQQIFFNCQQRKHYSSLKRMDYCAMLSLGCGLTVAHMNSSSCGYLHEACQRSISVEVWKHCTYYQQRKQQQQQQQGKSISVSWIMGHRTSPALLSCLSASVLQINQEKRWFFNLTIFLKTGGKTCWLTYTLKS